MDAHKGTEPSTSQPKIAPVLASETIAAIYRQNSRALKTARNGISRAAPKCPPYSVVLN